MRKIENKKNYSQTGFLQVSINTQKLTEMFEEILKKVKTQESEIDDIKNILSTMKKSLVNTIDDSEEQLKVELNKFSKLNAQEFYKNKLFLEQIDKNLEKKNIVLQKKLKDRQHDINKLYQKNQELQHKINEAQTNRIALHQETLREIDHQKQKFFQLKEIVFQSDEKFARQVQMVLLKVQAMISEYNSGFKLSLQRQNRFDKKITSNMSANLAQFSQKLDKMQKKLKDQKNPVLNNVLYSKKNDESYLIKSGKIKENQSLSEIKQNKEEKLKKSRKIISKKQLQESVSKRIYEQMEQKSSQKFKEMAEELKNSKNKMLILDQKLNIQSRKLQKQHIINGQLKYQISKLEDRRSDDQLADILRNQMKKHVYQLGEQIQKRLIKEEFQKQKHKVADKLNIIQQNIAQKADKGQIKKAIIFLEQKIKQLILLVANEQSQDKDGAIKKIPIKCLSCDKGLQTAITTPRQASSRTTTSHLRKRMKMKTSQIIENK